MRPRRTPSTSHLTNGVWQGDETVRFQKSRKQRGYRARDAITAARRYADIEVMFWMARARPYQRTKRREPLMRAADRWVGGREGRWNFGQKTRKPTMGRRRTRETFRNNGTTSGRLREGGGDGPDAGGAVSVERDSAGHCSVAVVLHLPREIGGDDETPVNGQPLWR